MNPATGWLVAAAWLTFGCICSWFAIAFTINLSDTIRMWRNDRRDARDVKRGVL